MLTCTRKLEWDAMHRVPGHEGACKAFHGHRYVAEITCRGKVRSSGMIIDFGLIKTIVGAWIDENWDHTAILYTNDRNKAIQGIVKTNKQFGKPVYFMEKPPTAEYISAELAKVSTSLLKKYDIEVIKVKVMETPNCWAEWNLNE